jgi:Protein of unknown function (DUF3761)
MANLRNIGISLLAAFAIALPATAKTAAKNEAKVTCSDGTTAKKGRGACSHHGGVASTAEKTDKAAEKTDKAAEPSKDKTRAELDQGKKETKEKSGGILDSMFGRKKNTDTAQGRSSSTTPRSSTRETKSGDAKNSQPTARCKDGTTSYSAHHSGTCSNHGGVAEWLDK